MSVRPLPSSSFGVGCGATLNLGTTYLKSSFHNPRITYIPAPGSTPSSLHKYHRSLDDNSHMHGHVETYDSAPLLHTPGKYSSGDRSVSAYADPRKPVNHIPDMRFLKHTVDSERCLHNGYMYSRVEPCDSPCSWVHPPIFGSVDR